MSPKDANIITLFSFFNYVKLSLACFSISVIDEKSSEIIHLHRWVQKPNYNANEFQSTMHSKGGV